MPDSVTRDDVVAAARDLVGAPWKHQGRNAKTGVDCVGFVVLVARALEIPHWDRTDYNRRANRDSLTAPLKDQMIQIGLGEVGDGDVMVFGDIGPYPCHLGIRSTRRDTAHIIHAYARWRKVVEQPLDKDLWRQASSYAFRFPGLEA